MLRLGGKPCCWEVTEAEVGRWDPVSQSPSLEPLRSSSVGSKPGHKGAEFSLMLGLPQRPEKGVISAPLKLSVTCPCLLGS